MDRSDWEGAWRREKDRHHNLKLLLATAAQLPKTFELGNRDPWIEGYLEFLNQENIRLSGGAIGRHYLHCANAAYWEWLSSGLPAARFRTWLAIRITCQWLSQLGERHERVIPPERTRG